ncbi:MAG: LytTR family transcriptional regulator [Mesorhizobium sp.]|uniref:LytTR family DNA-binding domain-containing protein n=1 Tax=Mesorhizobium sp. TaxID=1871066 RepID=UPI001AC4EAB9|nr:LytTR family DNA-binding domain-containing protein [Mesorhizobium sp.]MBN9220075.1 LytTR family transcriptional regulator [Mesorhizobium sp.]
MHLRQGTNGYVNGALLHSTLREMQALLLSPRFWGALLAVSAILGLTGPFGTLQQLDALPRFAYWLALAFATFTAGYLTMRLTLAVVFGSTGSRPLRSVVAGMVAGAPVTAIVVLFNHLLFGGPFPSAAALGALFVNCGLIAVAISFLVAIGRSPQGLAAKPVEPATAALPPVPTAQPSPPPEPARPPLIDRLPHAARGKLRYLSMQDHYVDVHTDKGSALVLMRFADALREVGDVKGVQIHRSHWVALDAVAGNRRKDGKLFLKLANDVLLPVSRSYAGAVRKAGLA